MTETNNPEQEPIRIYVASLADYNAGRLHGAWIDADQSAEAIQQEVAGMLAKSPEPSAEEYAVHDYEGFGPLTIPEYEVLATVARIAAGYRRHGRAFLHWAAYVGTHDPDELDRFEDAYVGWHESLTAFGEDLAEAHGIDDTLTEYVPAFIRPYVRIDYRQIGADQASAYFIVTDTEGGVHLFDG